MINTLCSRKRSLSTDYSNTYVWFTHQHQWGKGFLPFTINPLTVSLLITRMSWRKTCAPGSMCQFCTHVLLACTQVPIHTCHTCLWLMLVHRLFSNCQVRHSRGVSQSIGHFRQESSSLKDVLTLKDTLIPLLLRCVLSYFPTFMLGCVLRYCWALYSFSSSPTFPLKEIKHEFTSRTNKSNNKTHIKTRIYFKNKQK